MSAPLRHTEYGAKLDFWPFVLLFFYALFFPSFFNALGSTGAIVVNGTLIAAIAVFIGIHLKLRFPLLTSEQSVFWTFLVIFLLLLIHIPFAIFVGMLVGEVPLVFRDAFELHRPLLYFLIFTLAFYTFKSERSLAKLEPLLLVTFFLLALLGLNQFLRQYDFISELYTKPANIQSRRVAVPFANPYDYAFMQSFYLFYFFIKALFVSRSYFFLAFLALVMFVLPQSRSVAVGVLIGFFLLMPAALFTLGFKLSRLSLSKPTLLFTGLYAALILALLAAIPYLLENFSYLTGQFIRLLEQGEIGSSASIRLEQFLFALEKAQNPFIFLFGNGPAKGEMEFVESIYNYQFYRYGIIGVFLYFLAPLGLGIFFSWKILRQLGRGSRFFSLYLSLFVWFLTLPVMMIGNNFTEQPRLSFFYYSLLGLLASSYARTCGRSMETGTNKVAMVNQAQEDKYV